MNIDKEEIIKQWKYLLDSGKLTPNMKTIVQATYDCLMTPGSYPNKTKVVNTLRDMVGKNVSSRSMDKLLISTIVLLERD